MRSRLVARLRPLVVQLAQRMLEIRVLLSDTSRLQEVAARGDLRDLPRQLLELAFELVNALLEISKPLLLAARPGLAGAPAGSASQGQGPLCAKRPGASRVSPGRAHAGRPRLPSPQLLSVRVLRDRSPHRGIVALEHAQLAALGEPDVGGELVGEIAVVRDDQERRGHALRAETARPAAREGASSSRSRSGP